MKPEVQRVLSEVDGDTYVRIRVSLTGAHFTQEARDKLQGDWMCTHLMQTARLAVVEVPRKFVEELEALDEVIEIREVMNVY